MYLSEASEDQRETVLMFLTELGITAPRVNECSLIDTMDYRSDIYYDGIIVGQADWLIGEEIDVNNIPLHCWGAKIVGGVVQEVHVKG